MSLKTVSRTLRFLLITSIHFSQSRFVTGSVPVLQCGDEELVTLDVPLSVRVVPIAAGEDVAELNAEGRRCCSIAPAIILTGPPALREGSATCQIGMFPNILYLITKLFFLVPFTFLCSCFNSSLSYFFVNR